MKSVLLGLMLLLAGCSHSESSLREKIVKIHSGRGMCSGEQVQAPSGASYILSAGHCKVLMNDGAFSIRTEDGREMKRKFIAEDANSDLILIEGIPNMPGIDIAPFAFLGEKVFTLTHGNNLNTYRTDGELVELQRLEIPLSDVTSEEEEKACNAMPKNKVYEDFFGEKLCILDVWEVISTAPIVPGSSGGAVFNSFGNLVAVVSAGNPPFGAFVTLADIKAFLKNY